MCIVYVSALSTETFLTPVTWATGMMLRTFSVQFEAGCSNSRFPCNFLGFFLFFFFFLLESAKQFSLCMFPSPALQVYTPNINHECENQEAGGLTLDP